MTFAYKDKIKKAWSHDYEPRHLQWNRLQTKRHWILAPFYLIYDLCAYVVHKTLGKFGGRNVVRTRRPEVSLRKPLGGEHFKVEPHQTVLEANTVKKMEEILDEHSAVVEKDHIMVKTSRFNCKLHTFQICHKDFFGLAEADQKVTIILNGNTVRTAHPYALDMQAEELRQQGGEISKDRMVIGFDWPGVGRSEGPDDDVEALFESVRAQLARVLSMGINPKNVTLRCHSLGGFVGLRVGLEAHKLNACEIKLFIDRSSPSLSAIQAGYAHEKFYRKGWPRLGRIAQAIAHPFFWLLQHMGRADKSSVGYLGENGIDHRYLKYSAIRFPKSERVGDPVFLGGDRNIIHSTSLHYKLKNVVQKGLLYSRSELKKHMRTLEAVLDRNDAGELEILNEISAMRSELRGCKYVPVDEKDRNCHARRMVEMHNRHNGQSMDHDYKEFRDAPISDRRAEWDQKVQGWLEFFKDRLSGPEFTEATKRASRIH